MNPAFQMDEVDRKILRALQEDAGLSHAALAERVGASPTSCWRRIKALEEAGVLRGAVRLVDPRSVGRGVNVMLQVRMKSHAPEMRQAFETFLRARPEIMECYSMSGEWDYLLRIVVADVADYERFLMRELLNHPNVAVSASHFALSQVKYTTAVPV
ncbi:Lrp/AsnC family transcriptional regulator [Roseomonas hellenica]|uniref:Lrp/AsnC family transcriptional regulator n=2 Tax=Plastoroseomonas hellenica TaxID=2687306 RepID=A0ABS5F4L9_9PROT|nr:Lrp/AsnC family transcriptional regulator [Plastoroseomonas hellenica]MBR0646566.1 Lrp/AsnC family transcriptional regulator [Plastoroseomonas hellenica]MBR0667529.1 Lrp/AsnC family transcriptional regulator [Plastoroseomonas hellenica]